MIFSMAKDKTTITVDRRKVDEVQRLTGAASTSAAIDLALDQLLRTERLRGDVAAYTGVPPAEDEISLGTIAPPWSDLADDTDWPALYAVDE
jgi:hypothetical protein